MLELDVNLKTGVLEGAGGELPIDLTDEAVRKLFMLIEGECGQAGPGAAATKYGYSRGRYYQVLTAFHNEGHGALVSKKRGPKTKSRRTPELERLVIRYRYLDPQMSAEVIAQKLRQLGHQTSARTVYRIIEDFGLQKRGSTVSPAASLR